MNLTDWLLQDLLEDVRELDAYTPEWASEKWQHGAIVARMEKRLEALLRVREHAETLLAGAGDEAVVRLRAALDDFDALTGASQREYHRRSTTSS